MSYPYAHYIWINMLIMPIGSRLISQIVNAGNVGSPGTETGSFILPLPASLD